MKFIHTSDWHLGKSIYAVNLLEYQREAVRQIVKQCKEHDVDALIISGDIYDTPVTSTKAMALFNNVLREVAVENKISVLYIPGNHDSPERLAYLGQFQESCRVHVPGSDLSKESLSAPIVLKDKSGDIFNFYIIPFLEPAQLKRILEQDDIRTQADAWNAVVSLIHEKRPKEIPSVIVAHAFVQGCQLSESVEEIQFVGGAGQVDSTVFADFNYAALGHLHRPQKAGGYEHVRYSGSIYQYSFDEPEEKNSLLVEIKPNTPCTVTSLPLQFSRNLRQVGGKLVDLLTKAQKESPEERDQFMYVELHDEGPVINAEAQLRAFYPNLLRMTFKARTLVLSTGAHAGVDAKELGIPELFESFYLNVTGQPLLENEANLLRELVEEQAIEERAR